MADLGIWLGAKGQKLKFMEFGDEGERTCNFCRHQFRTRFHMETHIRDEHNQKKQFKYVCRIEGCGRRFQRDDWRIAHQERHHNSKRIKKNLRCFSEIFLLDILYDSWSPAMTVSSVCISILSMLSSSTIKQPLEDKDRYVRKCRNGRSPKETRWWFHDDKV